MRIPILIRRRLYIETVPRFPAAIHCQELQWFQSLSSARLRQLSVLYISGATDDGRPRNHQLYVVLISAAPGETLFKSVDLVAHSHWTHWFRLGSPSWFWYGDMMPCLLSYCVITMGSVVNNRFPSSSGRAINGIRFPMSCPDIVQHVHSLVDLFWGGGTKPIFSVPLIFLIFSPSSKHWLPIEYHVHIWQVSPQLSCGDTSQIWKWCEEPNIHILQNQKCL